MEEACQSMAGVWLRTAAQYKQRAFLETEASASGKNVRAVSYEAAHNLASHLASTIQCKTAKPGSEEFAVVFAERSASGVLAELSCVLAGIAYVCVDASAPLDWLELVARKVKACVVLCDPAVVTDVERAVGGGNSGHAHGHPAVIPFYTLDEGESELQDTPSSQWKAPQHVLPSAAMYAVFTSGTSGVPKAMVVEHANVLHYTAQEHLGSFNATDRVLMTAAVQFDIHLCELWSAIAAGATLVPASPATLLDSSMMRSVIETRQITRMFLAAGLFRAHSRSLSTFAAPLQHLSVGGDVVPLRDARRLARRYPMLSVVAAYGPAECTFWTSFNPIRPYHPELDEHRNLPPLPSAAPLGSPRPGVTYTFRACGGDDGEMEQELIIEGPAVARGYIEHDSTAFGTAADGARSYATGDLVRTAEDGSSEGVAQLQFCGRIKGFHLVKVYGGNRVSTVEIEARLRLRVNGLAHLVVIPVSHPSAEDDKALVAFYVRDPEGCGQDSELAARLKASARKLPVFMRPISYHPLKELALNSNGKVDSKRLVDMYHAEIKGKTNKNGTRGASMRSSGGVGVNELKERIRAAVTDVARHVLPGTEGGMQRAWRRSVSSGSSGHSWSRSASIDLASNSIEEQIDEFDHFGDEVDLLDHVGLRSIDVIRVAAELKDYGVTVSLIMDHRTIEAISAAALDTLTPVRSVDMDLPDRSVDIGPDSVETDRSFPASPSQLAYAKVAMGRPRDGLYIVQRLIRFTHSDLRLDRWRWLFEEHPILRVGFDLDLSSMVLSPATRFPLEVIRPASLGSAELRAIVAEDRERGLDVLHGPCFRLTLIETAGNATTHMLFSFSHAILDGLAADALLSAIYNETPLDGPLPLPSVRQSPHREAAYEFFTSRTKAKKALESTRQLIQKMRHLNRTARENVSVGSSARGQTEIRHAALEGDVSSSMLTSYCVTAWILALLGTELPPAVDIVLFLNFSGRTEEMFDTSLGPYMVALPIVVSVKADEPLSALFGSIRREVMRTFAFSSACSTSDAMRWTGLDGSEMRSIPCINIAPSQQLQGVARIDEFDALDFDLAVSFDEMLGSGLDDWKTLSTGVPLEGSSMRVRIESDLKDAAQLVDAMLLNVSSSLVALLDVEDVSSSNLYDALLLSARELEAAIPPDRYENTLASTAWCEEVLLHTRTPESASLLQQLRCVARFDIPADVDFVHIVGALREAGPTLCSQMLRTHTIPGLSHQPSIPVGVAGGSAKALPEAPLEVRWDVEVHQLEFSYHPFVFDHDAIKCLFEVVCKRASATRHLPARDLVQSVLEADGGDGGPRAIYAWQRMQHQRVLCSFSHLSEPPSSSLVPDNPPATPVVLVNEQLPIGARVYDAVDEHSLSLPDAVQPVHVLASLIALLFRLHNVVPSEPHHRMDFVSTVSLRNWPVASGAPGLVGPTWGFVGHHVEVGRQTRGDELVQYLRGALQWAETNGPTHTPHELSRCADYSIAYVPVAPKGGSAFGSAQLFPIVLETSNEHVRLSLASLPSSEARVPALFSRDIEHRAEETLKKMLRIAEFMAERGSSAPLSEAPLLAQNELDWLMKVESGGKLVHKESVDGTPLKHTVAHLWFDSVCRHRDADAVRDAFGREQWTYGQLHACVLDACTTLRERNVRGQVVAVCLPRCPALYVVQLAIAFCGATILALDPSSAPERNQRIVSKVKPALLVIPEEQFELYNAPLLASEGIRLECELPSDWMSVEPLAEEEVLGCIVFTSGTTKQPKGICVLQRNMYAMACNRGVFHFVPGDVVLPTAAVQFDMSFYEGIGVLMNGGVLVLAPTDALLDSEAFGELIREHGVTKMNLTASVFHFHARVDPTVFSTMKAVSVGGDVVQPHFVSAVRRSCPGLHICPGWGPTECTQASTYAVLPKPITLPGSVPIGRPVDGERALILDVTGERLPVGVPGELVMQGTGVSRGYLKGTAEDVDQDRFRNVFGEWSYHSGDLCYWMPDGQLYFIGRKDLQVKIRGYRVELGEVQAGIVQLHEVEDAAVLALGRTEREEDARNLMLVAFIIARSPIAEQDHMAFVSKLRAELASSVPSYLVPEHWVVLEQFPMTVNQKLDKKSLEANFRKRRSFGASGAVGAVSLEEGRKPESREQLRSALSAIWRSLLEFAPHVEIDIERTFCELGGVSLQVGELKSRVKKCTGVDLSTSDVYQKCFGAMCTRLVTAMGLGDAVESKSTEERVVRVTSSATGPIAVVGAGCRLPGPCTTPMEFWNKVLSERDLLGRSGGGQVVGELEGEEELFWNDIDALKEHGVSAEAEDLAEMGPHARLFLNCAVEACAHAAAGSLWKSVGTLGVISSSSIRPERSGGANQSAAEAKLAEIGASVDFIPSHVARVLGATGPAFSVQNACSSSLTAVEVAVELLRSGKADAMLVGGVALSPAEDDLAMQDGRDASGHCSPFDERAAGGIPTGGCTVLLLCSEQVAAECGCAPIGVIRHVVSRSDGERALFTHPNHSVGLRNALVWAHNDSGIPAEHTKYMVCSASGNVIGDAWEVETLSEVFGDSFPVLGAPRGHVGSLEHAFGSTALLWALLAARTASAPPIAHLESVSKGILNDLPDGVDADVVLPRSCCRLQFGGASRFVGVYAVGLGGVVTYCLVESCNENSTGSSAGELMETIDADECDGAVEAWERDAHIPFISPPDPLPSRSTISIID